MMDPQDVGCEETGVEGNVTKWLQSCPKKAYNMFKDNKLEVLVDERVLVDTSHGDGALTIDGVPFVPMVDLDPNCECAVGCEFGCVCFKREGYLR